MLENYFLSRAPNNFLCFPCVYFKGALKLAVYGRNRMYQCLELQNLGLLKHQVVLQKFQCLF